MDYFKFIRDSGTCFLTVLLLLSYGVAGEVGLWQAALLPSLYVVYVVVVLCTERTKHDDDIQDLELPVLQSHGTISWGPLIEDYIQTEASSSITASRRSLPAHSLKASVSWSLLRLKINWESS